MHGVVRRTSSLNRSRRDQLRHVRSPTGLHLHRGDLTGAGRLQRLVRGIKLTEIYNVVAQSHDRVSFDQPKYTADMVERGTLRRQEACQIAETPFRFHRASTLESFGVPSLPRSAGSRFRPCSPCAVHAYAHWISVFYLEGRDLSAGSDIFFNHESPRCDENFVTRKTTGGVATYLSHDTRLHLGSLDARRNWGRARDYAVAMCLMLQQSAPSDYVIGTGVSRSAEDLVKLAFGLVGLDRHDHIDLDPAYLRPSEGTELLAGPSQANQKLGWYPPNRLRGDNPGYVGVGPPVIGPFSKSVHSCGVGRLGAVVLRGSIGPPARYQQRRRSLRSPRFNSRPLSNEDSGLTLTENVEETT